MAIFWIAFFIALAVYGLAGLGPDTRDSRYSLRLGAPPRPAEAARGTADVEAPAAAVGSPLKTLATEAASAGTAGLRANGIANIAASPRSSADRAGAF